MFNSYYIKVHFYFEFYSHYEIFSIPMFSHHVDIKIISSFKNVFKLITFENHYCKSGCYPELISNFQSKKLLII